jgi:ATP-binding cassette subfamily B protein
MLVLITTIASSIMLPAQMWISKVVLDQITVELQQGVPNDMVAWGRILTPIGSFFLIWLMGVVCQSLGQSFKELLATRLEYHVQYLLLYKASSLSISFYETPSFYDQMNNARRQVWRVVSVFVEALEVFRYGVSFIITLIFLARVGIFVPFVLLMATLPQAAVQAYFTKQRYGLYLSRATDERKLYYFSWLLTAREAAKEIRLFQLQPHFLNLFRQSTTNYFRQIRKITMSKERANVGLALLTAFGTLVVWVYAIFQTVLRRITIGDLALTFQAAELCRSTLSEGFHWSGVLFEHYLYLRNLFDFLDLPPDTVAGSLRQRDASAGENKVALPAKGEIEFQNVSFRYPGTEKVVLENLSFVLRPGETVALVGENGAGKTTIVKLIARLYDPTEGRILMDGKDLRAYRPEDYYGRVGIIFQDFVRYDLSVQDNIGFGQLEYLGDQQRIRQAARKGGAAAMIEKLPMGYDTVLGKTFDEGVDLSGGEWQKIALSRAFMRDVPILILDEPTSSLDALAEQDIYNRFAELTAGKLTIFISHRLSSVKMANHILFLKEGRLLEEGTHSELLAKKGEYFHMFNIQAERYR